VQNVDVDFYWCWLLVVAILVVTAASLMTLLATKSTFIGDD
jgi:hypothetical protein